MFCDKIGVESNSKISHKKSQRENHVKNSKYKGILTHTTAVLHNQVKINTLAIIFMVRCKIYLDKFARILFIR